MVPRSSFASDVGDGGAGTGAGLVANDRDTFELFVADEFRTVVSIRCDQHVCDDVKSRLLSVEEGPLADQLAASLCAERCTPPGSTMLDGGCLQRCPEGNGRLTILYFGEPIAVLAEPE